MPLAVTQCYWFSKSHMITTLLFDIWHIYMTGTVLHRWKKNWFVLYRSGELAYFESQNKHEAEERFIVCAVCLGIKTSGDVSCLTQIYSTEG